MNKQTFGGKQNDCFGKNSVLTDTVKAMRNSNKNILVHKNERNTIFVMVEQ